MPPDSAQSLLLVDDDPNNIEILRLDLEDEGYGILTAGDGEEGWALLQEHRQDVKAILLDRMMPGMNGIEFTRKLRADAAVKRIPIIMQTAAAEKAQVVEGIEAGVYYYLTKPYEAVLMRSIVRAAIQDYERLASLETEVERFRVNGALLREARFDCRTLSEARTLATFIASLYPDGGRMVIGILELLVNAIEHGNLGISYAEKTRLLGEQAWEREIERRLSLPEYRHKTVEVRFERKESSIELSISDQGEGFDWHAYLEITAERATHSHGRGIAMSKLLSFDDLDYRGCGNCVIGTVKT